MPSSRDAPRRRLLAVGAIERDNFGDLLYVHLVEHFAADGFDIALGAPILPAVDLPLDRAVGLWPRMLDDERYDVAWAIGGEVGGTPPEYAYLTTHGTSAHRSLITADDVEHERVLADAMGGSIVDPPYLPRPALSARSSTASLVLSSVGLSGVAREPLWRRHSLLAALREAVFLSVRDRASSEMLTDLGLSHHLAPDLAHTVARVRPVQRDESDVVLLVHLSRHSFEKRDPEQWAHTLKRAFEGVEGEIRLFLAGLAPAHDSLSSVNAVREQLHALDPGRTVTVSETRSVWDRVEEIARASLWVGGSLHGRIVASAYGVPRVSFAKPKVDAYARDWDPGQPYGTGPESLRAAVTTALASTPAPRDDLAEQAGANIEKAFAALSEPSAPEAEAARRSAHRTELSALRAHARRLDRRLAARTVEVDRLRRALDAPGD